jgi:hypothetical protein
VRALVVSLIALSSLLVTVAKAPAVESSPMRKLVYSFERAVDQDITVKTQPTPVGSMQQADVQMKTTRGGQQYVAPGDEVPQTSSDAIEQTDAGVASQSPDNAHTRGTASSSGTIEVDVLREGADHGLVVLVKEQGKSASGSRATCVVYASTSLTCDSQSVNPEEYALLRFLGPGFVDPSQMDAQRRWRIKQSGAGLDLTAEYQVVHDSDGVLTVDENQTIESSAGPATTIRSTIGYDFNRSLPTSIDERVLQNQEAGTRSVARSTHTVLRLVSAAP